LYYCSDQSNNRKQLHSISTFHKDKGQNTGHPPELERVISDQRSSVGLITHVVYMHDRKNDKDV